MRTNAGYCRLFLLLADIVGAELPAQLGRELEKDQTVTLPFMSGERKRAAREQRVEADRHEVPLADGPR